MTEGEEGGRRRKRWQKEKRKTTIKVVGECEETAGSGRKWQKTKRHGDNLLMGPHPAKD